MLTGTPAPAPGATGAAFVLSGADGVFRTAWIKDLSSGDHYAHVVDLMMANYYWNRLLDLEDDDILPR